MSKSDKIRALMRLAYSGGVYHHGIISHGREYVYLLDSMGRIERCNVRLYDAGCPAWEVWATDTAVIRALSGHDIAMDCTGTAMQSLFHRGGTVSPWGVYVDKYNAPFISNV